MTELTDQIAARLSRVGMSERELQRRAGVGSNLIWRWKVGHVPSADVLARVEQVLKEMEDG